MGVGVFLTSQQKSLALAVTSLAQAKTSLLMLRHTPAGPARVRGRGRERVPDGPDAAGADDAGGHGARQDGRADGQRAVGPKGQGMAGLQFTNSVSFLFIIFHYYN